MFRGAFQHTLRRTLHHTFHRSPPYVLPHTPPHFESRFPPDTSPKIPRGTFLEVVEADRGGRGVALGVVLVGRSLGGLELVNQISQVSFVEFQVEQCQSSDSLGL